MAIVLTLFNLIVSASPRVFDEYALREVVVSVTRPTSTQVTFQCPVAGSAEPTITWLKDDYPSTLQLYKIDDPAYDLPDRFSILDGGRRLLLKAEGAGDSGRYACIARSSDGVTYSEVKLTVVEKPRIEPTAETLTATSTRSIDLFCDLLTRDSQVTIEWLKDDRPIEASNARYQVGKMSSHAKHLAYGFHAKCFIKRIFRRALDKLLANDMLVN